MKSKLSVSINRVLKCGNKCLLFGLIVFVGVGVIHYDAVAETLSINAPGGEVAIGQTFTIDINVDNSADVLGAAFTLKFVDGSGDPAPVEVVSVESDFFGTFQQQFVGTGICPACPTQAQTGEIQPLESNEWTQDFQSNAINAIRVAAARVDSSHPNPPINTLFSIDLKYTAGASDAETYKAEIIPTSLYNVTAGYTNLQGTEIALLVGYNAPPADTFFDVLSSGEYNGLPELGKAFAVLPDPSGTIIYNLDADGNASGNGFQDGFMIVRYMLGARGDAVTNGVIGAGATRTSAEINVYCNDAIASWQWDIDGNSQNNGFQDGFMIVRYMLGARGDAVTAGAIGSGATRTTPEINAYLDSLMIP